MAKNPKVDETQQRKDERTAIRSELTAALDGTHGGRTGYDQSTRILAATALLVRAMLNVAETVEAGKK